MKSSVPEDTADGRSSAREPQRHRLSRRQVLLAAGAGAGVVGLGAGTAAVLASGSSPATAADRIAPTDPEVRAAERARAATGQSTRVALVAAPGTLDLAGRPAQTWLYNGTVGQEIRLTVGDELRARVTNRLTAPTTVHWHGLALRNDMDGVPDVTAPAIAPGDTFDYRFIAPHPGTYWFHPHVGIQLDTGLLSALIIEDPNEPLRYDDDVTLMFDDWLDGVTSTPDRTLEDLRDGGMDMDSMEDTMDMGSMEPTAEGAGVSRRQPLGEDTGDVEYRYHLVNGRPAADPFVIEARPGRRLRLRLINAGSDTAYEFSVGGHRLRVVASDGFPVEPVVVDSLVLGMGERFDVLVEVGDGAFPVTAVPVGKPGTPAFAVLRTGGGETPKPARAQRGRLLQYRDLVPQESVRMPAREPDRTLTMDLRMEDGGRAWVINGRRFPDHEPLDLQQGERVRLEFVNRTMMFHPMHVHGHTFGVVGNGVEPGAPGLRKDTVNVLPMQRLTVDFDADNPGQWLTHCHNGYHAELGMATVLSYVR